MTSHPFDQMIGTHFARYAPQRMSAHTYRLTLKNGEHPVIGTAPDADLRVAVCEAWQDFDILPFRHRSYSNELINVTASHEDFFHRDNLWGADSFMIQPVRNTRDGPVLKYNVMRRPKSPEKPRGAALFAPRDATASQWSALMDADSSGYVLGGTPPAVDMFTWPAEFLAIRDADNYLNMIKRRIETFGVYYLGDEAAVDILQAHALLGDIPTHYPTYAEYLRSPRWAEIRQGVMKRDAHTCVFCKSPGEQVHHVVYPKVIGTEEPASLVTVCRRCHHILHGALEAGGAGDRNALK